MRVFEVMTEGVQTVSPAMPASDACELMRGKRLHHLVVTQGKEILGVLSDRDTGGRVGAAARAGLTVADIMTRHVVTVGRTDTIRTVANLMRGRTIGCVPVLDEGKLVGILTVSDLLEMLGRGIERPAKPARPLATHRVPHRKSKSGRAAGVW
jgi:acetoin utilization protein AcuB